MDKVIFWDFQGTLAYNDYMFSKVLYKVLFKDNYYTKITIDDFKRTKMNGFPWQDCTQRYNPSHWWSNAEKIFNTAYIELGISNEKALQYSRQVRTELLKAEDFKLFDDTMEVLKYFNERGYKNIILSNHIPELEIIINKLGLDMYISECISSGKVGYEKPNIEIFKYALEPYKNSIVWMVGDNYIADIKGGEQLGFKTILVRTTKVENGSVYSKDLCGVKNIIK